MTSTSVNVSAKGEKPAGRSLREALNDALPSHFSCKTRYLRSPSKPCEPLFSTLPGQEQEKTRLASHFLAISVDASELSPPGEGDVISFAIEVLIYTTKRLTTIFVSKVDSTSYKPQRSPIKTAITTFLNWLADKERRRRANRTVVLSLFARAQAQYLFPGSSDDKGKHVLDDRQLIKWWARVLDPIIPTAEAASSGFDADIRHQGYLTVPGYAKTELRSFMPASTGTSGAAEPRWLPGHPLIELGRTRGVPEHAPPRCLLPRFPDDPKARFILDLDDEIGISQDSHVTTSPSKTKSVRWKSVMSLDQFWEQMEFRQECSSGRAVGFLWLVISPNKDDDDVLGSNGIEVLNADGQESGQSSEIVQNRDSKPRAHTNDTPKKSKRKALTGIIIPRLPKIKSSQSSLSNMRADLDADSGDGVLVDADGYDKAMSTMLHLDFSTLEAAIWSTTKWIADVRGIARLNGDFAAFVVGTAPEVAGVSVAAATGGVNDMSGMIRKKRKADDGNEAVSSTIQPAVNLLGAGMVRKKAKSTSS